MWQDRGRVRITRPREMARLQGVPDALPVPASEQAANSLTDTLGLGKLF